MHVLRNWLSPRNILFAVLGLVIVAIFCYVALLANRERHSDRMPHLSLSDPYMEFQNPYSLNAETKPNKFVVMLRNQGKTPAYQITSTVFGFSQFKGQSMATTLRQFEQAKRKAWEQKIADGHGDFSAYGWKFLNLPMPYITDYDAVLRGEIIPMGFVIVRYVDYQGGKHEVKGCYGVDISSNNPRHVRECDPVFQF